VKKGKGTSNTVPLSGMVGKRHFGRFVDMKDPLKEDNDRTEA